MRTSRASLFGRDVREVTDLADTVRRISFDWRDMDDLGPLFDRIGNARFVLLGEASHGTSEYYTWRSRISQELIREKGFNFIAVEADWPDAYSLNRYVKGYPDSGDAAFDALKTFERWPTWMWANWEIVALAEWLRQYNSDLPNERKVGFHGLDVYSLYDSLREILEYLERTDPSAVETARRAFRCFEPYGEDVEKYAYATALVPTSCEAEVLHLLRVLRDKAPHYPGDREEAFNAEQNAMVAVGAERYYRTMIKGGAESWNVRDYHMADTLDRLTQFYGQDAKAIVWEHNTHVGDARATDMAEEGMVNVGQLTRERHEQDGVVLVGFAGHHGSVIAGAYWGAPIASMPVPTAAEGSWEDVFYRAAGRGNKLLITEESEGYDEVFAWRGHRAIGVVYNPANERYGNYVPTVLPHRYDAFLYLYETEGLHPLWWKAGEMEEAPETYPWGV